MTRAERVKGGLIGLLIGDALGVPYEFHAADDIPAPALLEFASPPGFERAHYGVPPGTGSGYVVDCLRSARWCAGWGAYEAVVRRAVALGHDTDTTACVAGGIAGMRVGVSGIPERWRTALRGQEILHPLLTRLLTWETQSQENSQ